MTILLVLIAILVIVVLFLGISFWSALPGEPPLERDENNGYRHKTGASNKSEKQDGES